MEKTSTSVSIGKCYLHSGGNISSICPQMASGIKLLVVEDENIWTQRTSPPDSRYRKDMLLVDNGVIQNDPISTYNNSSSSPLCAFYNTDQNQKTFKNLTFIRNSASTHITNLVALLGQYNVLIENIIVNTTSNATINIGDSCIRIINSININVVDTCFNRTYSSISNYGYGIEMDNVYNSYFENVVGFNLPWGLFGTRNTNTVELKECHINRFDVHCYGCNVYCEDCTFENTNNDTHTYNRYSSIYGFVKYKNCTFIKFKPLQIDSDYNAFTAFDLIMENCEVSLSTTNDCLIYIWEINNTINQRAELALKCLPNIIITDMTLHALNGVTTIYFYKVNSYSYTSTIKYMDTFQVDIVSFSQQTSGNVNLVDSNVAMELEEHLVYTIGTPGNKHNICLKYWQS